MQFDADGRIFFGGRQQTPWLADTLVGLNIEYLLPEIQFRQRVCDEVGPPGTDRREISACAEVDVGSIHAALTIRRLPSPRPSLYAVEMAISEKRPDPPLHPLAQALERSADAVLVTDLDGVIRDVNPAFEAMTGYARGEAIGRTPSILSSGRHSHDFYRALWDALRAGKEFRSTFVNRRKDGEFFHEEKTIRPLFDRDGVVVQFMAVGRDVSSRVKLMNRLRHAATHDPLTDLPNRSLFHERLALALQKSARSGDALTVVVVDVDRFKHINDTFGHGTGDEVMRAAAARLRNCVRETDTVARLGGDEFGVLLREQHCTASIDRVLEKILCAFATPLRAGCHDIAVTVSIGASLSATAVRDPQVLADLADAAMYEVKRAGGNGFLIRGDGPEESRPIRSGPVRGRAWRPERDAIPRHDQHQSISA